MKWFNFCCIVIEELIKGILHFKIIIITINEVFCLQFSPHSFSKTVRSLGHKQCWGTWYSWIICIFVITTTMPLQTTRKSNSILVYSSSIYSVKPVFLKRKLHGWFKNYGGIMNLTEVSNSSTLSWPLRT